MIDSLNAVFLNIEISVGLWVAWFQATMQRTPWFPGKRDSPGGAYDFSLKRAVIEVDRDADRRWSFATDKMKLAEDKDEVAPNSAPLEDFNCDKWSKWWFTSMAQVCALKLSVWKSLEASNMPYSRGHLWYLWMCCFPDTMVTGGWLPQVTRPWNLALDAFFKYIAGDVLVCQWGWEPHQQRQAVGGHEESNGGRGSSAWLSIAIAISWSARMPRPQQRRPRSRRCWMVSRSLQPVRCRWANFSGLSEGRVS